MIPSLYDEMDAVIDKIGKERPEKIRELLRNIRDRLPDEIEEVTVITTTENIVCDVLVNGQPVKLYCVVPKDKLSKYLKQRFDATIRPIRKKHRETKAETDNPDSSPRK